METLSGGLTLIVIHGNIALIKKELIGQIYQESSLLPVTQELENRANGEQSIERYPDCGTVYSEDT